MFRRLIIPAIAAIIVSIVATVVWSASPPPIITYQGKVLVSGSPASTTLPMQFTIYNALSGGTALYTASGSTSSPTNITITTTQGLFTVYLGDNGTNPINPEIFKDNDTLYLQVVINGEALNPRKRLATTPYALNSKYLDGYIATSTPTTTNYIPVSDASGNFSFNNITSTNIVVQKNNTSGVGSTISVLSANGNAAAGLFNYHVDSSTYHGILTLYSSVDDPSTPSLFFNAAPGGSSWIKSKLSIGTTTIPWYDLDVAGDINFTGNLYQDGILFSGGSLPSGILGQFLVHDGSDWLSTNTFTTTTFVTDILPSTHLTYTLGNSSSRFSEGWFENVYIGSSTWKLGQDENNLLTFTDINSSASSALAINNQGFVGFGISPGSAKVTIRDEGGVVTTSKPTNVRLIGFQCGGGMPSSLQWDAKVFAFKNTKSGPVYSEASISLNSPKNAESVCGPGVDAVPNWAWDAPVDDSVDGYILNLYLGAPGYNNWNIYAITQKTTFEAQNGDYEGDNLKFTSGGPFDATPTSGFGSLRNRDSLQLSYDENSYAAIKAYDTGALSIKTNGTNKGLYVSETGNLKIGSSFESSAKFFVENSQTGLEVIIQNSLSPNIQTLKVIDNTLYAIDRDPATGNKTFVIYDVTNKFSPSLISTIPPPVDSEFVENLEVSGNYAYIQERDAVGDVFIGIYNISNPASVSRVSQISNSNSFVDYIKEHNGRLYFSTIDITANPILRIYDISSGFPAGHIIDINLNSNAYKFIINNDFLYYYWGSNVEIIDLNNISNTSNRGVPEPINDIYILGDYLYVANGWRITIFEKVNSDPLNLDNVGDVWSENGNFTKIKVINSYLYGSINNGSLAGVEVKNAINGNYIDFYRSSQSNIGTFDVDNNNYVFTIEGIALSSILKLNEIENPAYAAIFNGGSVGIGTTNPEQTLSVVGNIGVTKGLYFGRNSRSSDTNYSLYSENGNLYWNGSSLSLPSGSVFGQTLYYDGWNWQASDNLINTGWNIGIGNSSPSYRLDVGGDINFTGTLYQNGTPFSSGSSLPSGLPGDILVNDSFGNWTNSSYIFVSSSSGFVGLNNSNPSDRLSIYGGVDITGMLKFGSTGGTANQVLMINPVTSLPYWTNTSSIGISGASLPS